MGIIKNGILGNIRKKVGPVVGAVSGGQNILRSLPASYKDKKSELQIAQRTAFSKAIDLHKHMSAFVRATNIERDARHSAYNVFVRKNVNNSITSNKIDFDVLVPSSGSLSPLSAETETTLNTADLTISWENNADDISAFDADNIHVIVIDKDTNDSYTKMNAAKRSTEFVTLTLPEKFKNKNCQIFLSLTNKKKKKSAPATRGPVNLGAELAGSIQ